MRQSLLTAVMVCAACAVRSGPAPAASGTPLALITVKAGDTARIDTPMSVALPAEINAYRPMRLVEVKGASRTPVACQVAQGAPRTLHWMLGGATAAGATRTFEMLRGEPVAGEGVVLSLNDRTLDVSFKGAPLFSYNHAHVIPPAGVSPDYIRSGYITPMFSPSGRQLTEDFPSDHYHHKGIWFPWTSTEFEGRPVDFWNLAARQGTVQYAGFTGMESGPVFGRFLVKHEHVDLTRSEAGRVVLEETWDVRIWAAGGREVGTWLWDLTSAQTCVADSPLRLKAYRYGGFGYRGPKEWKDAAYRVLTSEGHTKENGHGKRSRWAAHSGVIDGAWSTVVFMCHPSNERYQDGGAEGVGEPMRIWASGGCFFNYCPIQKDPMDLKPGETHFFTYRVHVHEGAIDRDASERAWRDFAHPPEVTLQLVK